MPPEYQAQNSYRSSQLMTPVTPHQGCKCPDPLLPSLAAPKGTWTSLPLCCLWREVLGDWHGERKPCQRSPGAQPFLDRRRVTGPLLRAHPRSAGHFGRTRVHRPLTLTGGPSALQPAILGHRGRFQANLEADLEELPPHVPDAVLMQGLPQKCSETSGAYPFRLPHHTLHVIEEPLPGGAPPEGLAVKPGGAALTEACHMAERRGSPCSQPTTMGEEREGHPARSPPPGEGLPCSPC